jgi:hypothetical protein
MMKMTSRHPWLLLPAVVGCRLQEQEQRAGLEPGRRGLRVRPRLQLLRPRRRLLAPPPPRLDVDKNVVLMPSCVLCTEM